MTATDPTLLKLRELCHGGQFPDISRLAWLQGVLKSFAEEIEHEDKEAACTAISEVEDLLTGLRALVGEKPFCACCIRPLPIHSTDRLCPGCAEDAYCEDEQRRDWEERQP